MINLTKKIFLTLILICIFIGPIFTLHNTNIVGSNYNLILIQDLYIWSESPNWSYLDDEGIIETVIIFKNENVNITILFLSILWFAFSVIWSVVSDNLKVYKPGTSNKFIFLWVIVFCIINSASALGCWYFMSQINEGIDMMGKDEFTTLFILSIVTTSLYFYLSSLFITSKAMRPSVPLANRILR